MISSISAASSGIEVRILATITAINERIDAGAHSEIIAFSSGTEYQAISVAVPMRIPAITPHLVIFFK